MRSGSGGQLRTAILLLAALNSALAADMAQVAARLCGAIAGRVPSGARIVVGNLTNASGQTTLLGVNLARQLSGELASRSGGRYTVIDRGLGETNVVEESDYQVDRPDPAALLESFQADVYVRGGYALNEARLDLTNLQVMSGTSVRFGARPTCRDNTRGFRCAVAR